MLRVAGNGKDWENAGLICKGNGVDIKQDRQHRPISAAQPGQKATLSTFYVDPRIHVLNETSAKLFNVGQNATQQILLPGRSLPVFSVCCGLLLAFAAWTKTKQDQFDPGRRTGTFEKPRLPPGWKAKPK